MYIAFGDANKAITLYPYMILNQSLKKSSINEEHKKYSMIHADVDLPKLVVENHSDSINTLTFTKTHKHYLISGSSDKCLMIMRINQDFSTTNMKTIKGQSDIIDIAMSPNDQFIFSGCADNNIYLWKANFPNNTFDLINFIPIHNNFVTSICLDPIIERNVMNGQELYNYPIKFASYVYYSIIFIGG